MEVVEDATDLLSQVSDLSELLNQDLNDTPLTKRRFNDASLDESLDLFPSIPRKKAMLDGEIELLENDEESAQSADPDNVCECGTIQKVILQNFMCHKYFEVELTPKVNFIIGRNGSKCPNSI
jgi:hypothetical protein